MKSKLGFFCGLFDRHDWQLIEEYQPMIRAQIFTGQGFEFQNIPTPFKPEGVQGKWKCMKCGQVSIGTRHNA